MIFDQIEYKRLVIGVSAEGAGKLNGTVSSNQAAGIAKNTAQFLTDCLCEVASGHQEQMSERLKIPTRLVLSLTLIK